MSARVERVIITGASRGIGRAVAARFLAEGRRVALIARDAAALEDVRRVAPERAVVIARDVASVPEGLIGDAARALGGVDGWVHAAGVAPHAPLEAITDEALGLAHALHVRAPLRIGQELAAHLRAAGRPGSMVLIASTLALRPAAGTIVYAATKAAQIALTKGLALELAPDAIRVNAIAPGVVVTDMTRALRLAAGEEAPSGDEHARRVAAQLEDLRALHPLGRLGTPDEVAASVAHVLDAEWMTGSVLTLDGGLTLG